jgi:hypothetical protein
MAETTSLHLRLPKKLYKRLQQQAGRNNVSLNTQIIQLLSRAVAFAGPGGQIPSEGGGEWANREGSGSELVVNLGGRLYRFVSEDTIDLLTKDGALPPSGKARLSSEGSEPEKK